MAIKGKPCDHSTTRHLDWGVLIYCKLHIWEVVLPHTRVMHTVPNARGSDMLLLYTHHVVLDGLSGTPGSREQHGQFPGHSLQLLLSANDLPISE